MHSRTTQGLVAILVVVVLSSARTATAADSFRAVCSGFDELQKVGISIDFLDNRYGAAKRKYTVSSIYQGALFQGVIIDSSGNGYKGQITLKHSSQRYFVGSFSLETDTSQKYSMHLDGKLNQDPSKNVLLPVKATLPCVDLSS
jgi:hypothetical protein